MLRECYRYQVEQRGHEFKPDEATEDHIARAARWLLGASTKPGLFLYGEPGNGKTTLARSIVQLIGTLYYSALSTERKEVTVIPASALTEAARGEKQDLLNRLKGEELLYIDDVGTEPASIKVWGNEVSPLVDLLYHRYDRQLFTVITSNLIGDEDIAKRYGLRIADRFIEMFDLIGFENPSYRPRLTRLPPP
ncbi:AAA family ATPase [Barnesiella sp. An55]|uniref:AAA family ATPase n=1 Tax=Barnesiella sp. An55 TaxID=1965646 RepID=UPI000B373269|nr:AAA family ATPase [Barnesiella sp. An55]OUN69501.1 replication protein [Barnesiella sp. An55]